MESYRTVARAAASEFSERRSRFLGAVWPVDSEEAALEIIAKRRREFWNATHNVYAYVLLRENVRRFSDDGEPQGTAGLPVLDVMVREGLFNCVVVVTRYFGGVLLGTGGLVRSYAHSAKLAIAESGMVTMRLCSRAVINCDYTFYGRIAALIPDEGGVLKDTRFTDKVEIEFFIPRCLGDCLQDKLTELSAGSLTFRVIGEEYLPFPVAE